MRATRTYTRHWTIEARQHEILGLDLGEGIPRKSLKYGFVACATWWGVLFVVFGFPAPPFIPVYLVPPFALTYYGARPNSVYWRRTNLLVWGIRLHYLLAGLQPVIGRGRLPTVRPGLRMRLLRLGEAAPKLRELPGLDALFAGARSRDPADMYGRPVRRTARPRLYGPDAVARARGKQRRGRQTTAD